MSDAGMWILAAYLAVGVIAGVLVARQIPDDDAEGTFYRGMAFFLIAACWPAFALVAAFAAAIWVLGWAVKPR